MRGLPQVPPPPTPMQALAAVALALVLLQMLLLQVGALLLLGARLSWILLRTFAKSLQGKP